MLREAHLSLVSRDALGYCVGTLVKTRVAQAGTRSVVASITTPERGNERED